MNEFYINETEIAFEMYPSKAYFESNWIDERKIVKFYKANGFEKLEDVLDYIKKYFN